MPEKRTQLKRWITLVIGLVALCLTDGKWNLPILGWVWPGALLYHVNCCQNKKELLPFIVSMAVASVIRWWDVLGEGLYIASALLGILWSCIVIFPCLLDRGLSGKIGPFMATLIFPTSHVLLQMLLSRYGFGTLGIIAYSQSGFLPMLQTVSIVGTFGLSLLMCWFGAALAHAAVNHFRWRQGGAVFLSALVLTGLLVCHGMARLWLHPEMAEGKETLRVASIVGPFYGDGSDGTYLDFSLSESKTYLQSEAERAFLGGAAIACWNEEAFTVTDGEEAEFVQFARELAEQYQVTLILPLEVKNTSGKSDDKNINCLYLIPTDGGETVRYLKTKLVPLVETFDFCAGDGQIPIRETAGVKYSAIICYDGDHPTFVNGYGTDSRDLLLQTQLLFVPTWDWPGIKEKHARCAMFRAVENGYHYVRPTYEGYSYAVDPLGRAFFRYDSSAEGYDHVNVVEVPVGKLTTLYGTYGIYMDGGILLLCCITLMLSFGMVIMKKRTNRS